MLNVKFLLLAPILSLLLLPELQAQQNDFREAEQLIREQQFEEAVPLLLELHQTYPESRIYFDRLIDLLIRTGQYDKALDITQARSEQTGAGFETGLLEGDILHRKGERDQALHVWNQLLDEYDHQLAIYFQLGATLTGRREYDEAVKLYRDGRERFGDETLFSNELFSAYMQMGNFSDAVGEYIYQVRVNPGRGQAIHQRLSRMQDRRLLSEAAGRIQNEIEALDEQNDAWFALHELLFSLLIETEAYEEAVKSAIAFDQDSPVTRHALFDMAPQLIRAGAYEWAIEAYSYYTNSSDRTLRLQAKDQKAMVYRHWAEAVRSHTPIDQNRVSELLQSSYDLSRALADEADDYRNRQALLLRLANLTLDLHIESEEVDELLEELRAMDQIETVPDFHLVEGRRLLKSGEWREARYAFDRLLQQSNDRQNQERATYYLALTDFLAGDYEYAAIQIRSLERQSDSRESNNALLLRVWIQEGQRSDESETILPRFGELIAAQLTGQTERALELLSDLNGHSLQEHALLEIAKGVRGEATGAVYDRLLQLNRNSAGSPLREQLLWYQAKLAEQLLNEPGTDEDNRTLSHTALQEMYEQLIEEFPQGFYAPFAREELQGLEQRSSL